MLVHDLFELRRNPEQNPRISAVDFLRQYKDNPKAYLHTAPINKVGIYPKSSSGHDSPAGIYAYRLMDIWERDIERWNTGEYKRGLEFLAYHGGNYLFILESDIDPEFPKNYSDADLKNDTEKLKKLYGISDDRMNRLMKAAETNLNFVDLPCGFLWGITKALVAGTYEFDEYTPVNTMTWNGVLRKLGYVGFNDPGYGFIHGAEHQQALFLTTSAFKVVDSSTIRNVPKTVTIGKEKYKGGRVPKNLHMTGFDSVFFLNNDKEDFKNVRTWTVDSMGIRDFESFLRFLPWNATGVIGTLGFGNAANESHENREVSRFFANYKPTKNIKIKSIYVGNRFPTMLLKYMPENFPVDQIKISQFSSEAGINTLPEIIQKKIVVMK